MNQFFILLTKELRDAWRSFKFLWIPLVFISLGVSEPIMNYYIEDILGAVGNLPEGFEMLFPELTPADVLVSTAGQFQSICIIILVCIFASSISRERQNGTATLLYVRPISYTSLFLSKWTVAILLCALSAATGFGASMYYTAILYGTVEPLSFIQMLLTYLLWLILVISVTLMLSALLRTPFAIALSLIIIVGGQLLDSLIGGFWTLSPYKLSNYGLEFLIDTPDPDSFIPTLIITLAIIAISVLLGILFSKKNAANIKI